MRQLAVVIVDDSPSVRAVVRRFLRGTPDIRVIERIPAPAPAYAGGMAPMMALLRTHFV